MWGAGPRVGLGSAGSNPDGSNSFTWVGEGLGQMEVIVRGEGRGTRSFEEMFEKESMVVSLG